MTGAEARPGRTACGACSARHPIGYLFVAPYVVYLGIFAYPLGFAMWMSFHDYFFAAPGATVDRPWVGFDNYTNALTDDTLQQSSKHRRDLPADLGAVDGRPRRCVATALNAASRSGPSSGRRTTSRT